MGDWFDPSLRELDMIWLSALVFLPAAVALLLFLIPARFKEGLRWVALFGTAGTLTLSLCTVIDYYRVLERWSPTDTRTLYQPQTRLDSRVDAQLTEAAKPVPGAFKSDDLVVYRPWVE